MATAEERQKMSAYRNKSRAAQHLLRDKYRSEYDLLLAAERQKTPEPKNYMNCVARALAKLGRAHRSEYLTLMGPRNYPKSRWVVGESGQLELRHEVEE